MRINSNKWMIGIDEAGRGPLAGPLVVAGIKSKIKNQKLKFWERIKDSKQLSAKRREEWFHFLITSSYIEWAAARVWPKTIDRINIARAANQAAWRVCRKLSPENALIVLDGSLYLPRRIPHETIVKGDERIPVIAAASIVAKVIRDRIMTRLHKKFPQYGFDVHKGYGTLMHRRCIRRYGYSEAHRRSFRCV